MYFNVLSINNLIIMSDNEQMMSDDEEIMETPVSIREIITTINDNYTYSINNKECISLIDFLRKNNTDNDLDTIIKSMNICGCCKRHQINKPSNLNKYIDTKFPNLDKNIICNCSCRHIARACCRAKFGFYNN